MNHLLLPSKAFLLFDTKKTSGLTVYIWCKPRPFIVTYVHSGFVLSVVCKYFSIYSGWKSLSATKCRTCYCKPKLTVPEILMLLGNHWKQVFIWAPLLTSQWQQKAWLCHIILLFFSHLVLCSKSSVTMPSSIQIQFHGIQFSQRVQIRCRNNRKSHTSKLAVKLPRTKIPRRRSDTVPQERDGGGDKWIHNELDRRRRSDVP